jgi:hypothetical protein
MNAPKEDLPLASAIYLANMLVHIMDGAVVMSDIDKNILASFGITKEEHIKTIVDRLELGMRNMKK